MDIAGAEKKLRQAAFFLGWLEHAPRDMPRSGGDPEHLEFYFSACLSAAQSVYYVLEETGGTVFRDAQKRWRGQLPEPQRSQFGKMIGLRGKDVHFGSTDAESLPKYVKEDGLRTASTHTITIPPSITLPNSSWRIQTGRRSEVMACEAPSASTSSNKGGEPKLLKLAAISLGSWARWWMR